MIVDISDMSSPIAVPATSGDAPEGSHVYRSIGTLRAAIASTVSALAGIILILPGGTRVAAFICLPLLSPMAWCPVFRETGAADDDAADIGWTRVPQKLLDWLRTVISIPPRCRADDSA